MEKEDLSTYSFEFYFPDFFIIFIKHIYRYFFTTTDKRMVWARLEMQRVNLYILRKLQ